jgi:putative transposase
VVRVPRGDQNRHRLAAANTYRVDPALAGRRVELVFSPFDLQTIDVRYRDQSFGAAVAHTITRHTHPKARPETVEPTPARTGIDYLALTAAAHHEQLRDDERIGYHALYGPSTDRTDDQVPGQLSITDPIPASGEFEGEVSA